MRTSCWIMYCDVFYPCFGKSVLSYKEIYPSSSMQFPIALQSIHNNFVDIQYIFRGEHTLTKTWGQFYKTKKSKVESKKEERNLYVASPEIW